MHRSMVLFAILASVSGCNAYKDTAKQEIQSSLDNARASSTFAVPPNVDSASKAGRTFVYWHDALAPFKVWKNRQKDVFTDGDTWVIIRTQLEGIPTQGVDEDAVHAVLTMSKAISAAINEEVKAISNAAVQSGGQNPAAGIVHGVTNGISGRKAADAALDNGRAEAARVRGILIARYGLEFPVLFEH